MTTRNKLVWLVLLTLPMSAFALDVQVRVLDGSGAQINHSNQVRAGIIVTGYNWVPYTLGGGFTLTCSFSSPQEIPVQDQINVAFGEKRLYLPGRDYAAEGTYQIANFENVSAGQCPVCTMPMKGTAVSWLSATMEGQGSTVTFGGGSLEQVQTHTFQMCKPKPGRGGGSGC